MTLQFPVETFYPHRADAISFSPNPKMESESSQ